MASPKCPASHAGPAVARWAWRLYVAGTGGCGAVALANLQRLCDERLCGDYWIEVIDAARSPTEAEQDQVVVLPTLVRLRPPPRRQMAGDLSDRGALEDLVNLPAE